MKNFQESVPILTDKEKRKEASIRSFYSKGCKAGDKERRRSSDIVKVASHSIKVETAVMDVSQLCSHPSDESEIHSSSNFKTNANNVKMTNKLDFILSTTETITSSLEEKKTEGALSTALELIQTQCTEICHSIWQLKKQHRTITLIERESMIDSLSTSANSLLDLIKASDFAALRLRDRKNSLTSNNNNEQELRQNEDDDDDIEEDEEEDDYLNEDASFNVTMTGHAEYDLIRQARNLHGSGNQRPKYRRRNRRSMAGQKCHSCNTTETPEWRRGPDGARTLCNACGLHYSKLLKKGSIGVQVQNYLTASTTQLPTLGNANPSINYPFVLMDPKYVNDKRLGFEKTNTRDPATTNALSLSSPTYYTPKRPMVDLNIPPATITPYDQPFNSGINVHKSNKVGPDSAPSLNKKDTGSKQHNIAPLRIHQWKQT
ncbi:hypothetical protein K501DRAFT_276988 [Backusella circina FSU 941]|nr:hypothetical protein K501DRAFT_276988 [Backusella circina FSU 941]